MSEQENVLKEVIEGCTGEQMEDEEIIDPLALCSPVLLHEFMDEYMRKIIRRRLAQED